MNSNGTVCAGVALVAGAALAGRCLPACAIILVAAVGAQGDQPVPTTRSVADFGAVGDGIHDDSAVIQQAIDAGYNGVWCNPCNVLFPAGKTYRISHQLILWSATHLDTDPENPATILLAPNTPGFQDPRHPRYMLRGRLSAARPDCPDNPRPFPADPNYTYGHQGRPYPGWPWKWPEQYDTAVDDAMKVHPAYGPGNNFWTQVRHLRFKIARGNPGAAGIYLLTAQGTLLDDVTVDMEDGKCAVTGCGMVVNCTFEGGRFGLVDPSLAEHGFVMNCRFIGQSEAAYFLESGWCARTFIDTTFEQTPLAVSVGHTTQLVMIECKLISTGLGVSLGDPAIPVLIQNLRAYKTPYLYRTATKVLAGDPDGSVVLPTFVVGDVSDNGNWVQGGGVFATSTRLPTWNSVPAGIDLSHAANVRDFGAVGDGQADDTEALRRAVAAAEVVYLPAGDYRVTDTILVRRDTKLVGEHVLASCIRIAPGTPGFTDAANPKPILDTPDDASGTVHIQQISMHTGVYDFGGNVGAILLRWRVGRASSVSQCNLPTGGTGVLVTSHGGGTFLNIWAPDAADTGFRADHNSEPLILYNFSSEHQQNKAFDLRGTRDATLYFCGGGEGAYPQEKVMNSVQDSDRIALISFMAHPTDDANDPQTMTVVRAAGTPGLWIGPLKRIHNEPVLHTVLDTRPGGDVVDLDNRGFVLYRWGELNQEEAGASDAWFGVEPAEWLVSGEREPQLPSLLDARARPAKANGWTVVAVREGALRLPPQARGASYAHLYVFSPQTSKVRIAPRSPAATGAWLNGNDLSLQAEAGDAQSCAARLRSGWSRLLVSLDGRQEDPALRLSIKTESGEALAGLRFRAEPPPITDVWALSAEPNGSQVRLAWRKPADFGFGHVEVIRNVGLYPRNAGDGDLVYSGRADHCTDTVMQAEGSVFYAVYAHDRSGAASCGVPKRVEIGEAAYITDWLACGPFAVGEGQGTGYEVDYIGEATTAPTPGAACAGKTWEPVRAPEAPGGMVDFNAKFAGGETLLNQVAYVHTYVHAPGPAQCQLLLGADDGYQVWVNGKPLGGEDRSGVPMPDDFRLPVTLEAGWNRLLIKITQGSGQWKVIARLARPDGSVVLPALTTGLSPAAPAASAAVVPAEVWAGLAHHWPLNDAPASGAVEDVVGGRHGTLANGATPVRAPVVHPDADPYAVLVPEGKPGAGVSIAATPDLAARDAFTLAGWIYMEADASGATLLGNYPGGGFQPGIFRLGVESSQWGQRLIRFEGANSRGEGFQLIPVFDWPSEEWVHLAATLDGNGAAVYANGGLVAEKTLPFAAGADWLAHASLPWKLGGLNTDTGEGEHYVDNVRVFDRALSADEVRALYLYEADRPGAGK